MRLAGFVYDGFGGARPANWEERLTWIRGKHREPEGADPGSFDTQPYEQLARVYREAGQDSEARKICIEARNDLRTYTTLGKWRLTVNWLLDVTIKDGYQPLRAAVVLLVLYGVAILVFSGAQHQDYAMVPAKATSIMRIANPATVCSKDYACFSPAGYAVDVTIPIITTRQSEHWRPNAAAPWGWAFLWGGWVITGLGWTFATLAVAGYTGLIRKDSLPVPEQRSRNRARGSRCGTTKTVSRQAGVASTERVDGSAIGMPWYLPSRHRGESIGVRCRDGWSVALCSHDLGPQRFG